MTHVRVWFCVLTTGLLSSAGLIHAAHQQAPPAATTSAQAASHPDNATDPPRFRVGVDAVRIDAVVTDKDGRPVSDLAADDFDLHQDGRPQKITLARWIPIAGPGTRPAPSPSAAPATPSPSSVPLPSSAPSAAVSRAEVQRTIVLVVDDLGTSFESMDPARRALSRFVDEELLPTDLVAVVRTSGAVNVMQQFTTDRRVLHNAIDALSWDWRSRSGVESLPGTFASVPLSAAGGTVLPPGFDDLDALRASMSASNSLGALALIIRGTRDLPGRKAMVLVSEGMRMLDRYDGPGGAQGHGVLPDIRVVMPLDHVVDQAVRAGVVVYALDPRGLQSGRPRADDNTTGLNAEQLPAQAASRHEFLIDTQDSLTHLAEQTGGFAVLNTNDLARGLRRVGDDQRGYYLLGYTPDDRTFAKPGKTIRYHKISVEVKRPGLRVRTHGGFIGVSDDEKRTAPTPGGEIYAAAMSPFAATAVPMRVTTEIGYTPGEGASVRAKLHVDARALAFRANTDGTSSATADILAVIVNADGKIVSSRSSDLAVNRDELDDQSLEAGLVYELQLPVPGPGGYQVRFALRDRRSGALGSAGQFVQVPDASAAMASPTVAGAVAEAK